MPIEFVPFEPAHFEAIELRPEEARDLEGLDRATVVKGFHGGLTAFDGDKVACIYGAITDGSGVAQMWLLTSALVERWPLLLTKRVRHLTQWLFAQGCHRVEVYCHVDNQRSLRWLTRLAGFQVEGIIRQSGANRQDRFLLSRVLPRLNGKILASQGE